MADRISKKQRSRNMSRVRGQDTSIKIAVRRSLFAKGYRYRLNYNLLGKPDIVFPKQRVAVFVHGCFWHQHDCSKSKRPSTNQEFWDRKLDKNMARDRLVKEELENRNWTVIYLWECKIKLKNGDYLKKITSLLN